jgi:hypothetical protein
MRLTGELGYRVGLVEKNESAVSSGWRGRRERVLSWRKSVALSFALN